jgi:hypothetical protein
MTEDESDNYKYVSYQSSDGESYGHTKSGIQNLQQPIEQSNSEFD